MTREEARKQGRSRYPGRPCPKAGHGTLRYVRSDACVACVADNNRRHKAEKVRPPNTAKAAARVNRDEAIRLGLPRYQGTPCKYGHDGERYIGGTCVTCAADYQRRLYWRDPDKYHARQKEFYDADPEKARARRRESHQRWMSRGVGARGYGLGAPTDRAAIQRSEKNGKRPPVDNSTND
jgi:hypothetical protein